MATVARPQLSAPEFVALYAGMSRGGGRSVDELVTEAIGRPARSAVVVEWWTPDGYPGVLANPPLLDDGTPMPTRWWLADPVLGRLVGRLEAAGGVKQAEAAVPPAELAAAHARYAAERDALLPADHTAPRPTGGVGGTRQGVKCLHAHLAWWIVGGDDPVGAWVAARLPGGDLHENPRPDVEP
ncbi:MAG: DUF501 domain-containing protein [Acidimicrobiia bacterium]|nr:DUF501 domain-containing protein [Acidimicrobiia bacterium]